LEKIFAAPTQWHRIHRAQPAREQPGGEETFGFILNFFPPPRKQRSARKPASARPSRWSIRIERHLPDVEAAWLARAQGEPARYRIAVLARAKKHLAPSPANCAARRSAFAPSIRRAWPSGRRFWDAVALARALLDPMDRTLAGPAARSLVRPFAGRSFSCGRRRRGA